MSVVVDKKLLYQLAHLSRLRFSDSEEAQMIEDLNAILDWVEELKAVDTEGIEPLTHISEEVNVLRADAVTDTISREQALKNAPKRDSDYFRVPKVIE
ncbi:Asp-tRNA(Asn)/Glu-tRNA(Gln) amidotransferase subunit GatC [Hugenholtzia roseola]|uniref:Asp-tRNA(Asn)/Glu-tRNA(Gln) amidotransferase subunit GatC n=1 Tax=Hugenholtzia roseola TaxID=1002 RepID=UPI000479D42D|nr:Asp-tRNA(Asn)/Glu-tRNA(Gln) amidotransferase subunit GatC [Hugenholtzia roseola]